MLVIVVVRSRIFYSIHILNSIQGLALDLSSGGYCGDKTYIGEVSFSINSVSAIAAWHFGADYT